MFLSLLTLLLLSSVPIQKNELFFVEGDTLKIYNADLKLERIQIIHNPQKIKLDEMHTKIIEDQLYFLGQMSGEVYRIEENEILRLDKTTDHRMTINANVFVHNDTLLKYGGYGYWSQRNFIIYYDMKSAEWEVYKKRGDFKPNGQYDGLSLKKNNFIVFFGGSVVNENDRLESIDNTKVVRFDFNSNQFEELGETNRHFNFRNLIGATSEYVVLADGKYVLKIDPLANQVSRYIRPNVLWNYDSFKSTQNKFMFGNFYIVSRNNLGEIEYLKISEEEMFKEPVDTFPLYAKNNNYTQAYIWSSLILLTFLIFIVIRNQIKIKQLILTPKGFIIKKVLYPLLPSEYEVLKKLIENKRLNTQEVLTIIQKNNLSYAHNIRLKEQFIKELNIKLTTLFKILEDPILQNREEDDRRVKYLEIHPNSKRLFERFIIN